MEFVSSLETAAPEVPAKRGRGRPRKYPVESAAPSSPAFAALEPPRPVRVRKPFGLQSEKLAYPERPGYRNYWFADHPGRISLAKEAGYEHILDEKGQPKTYPGGVAEGGGVLLLYLMEIPRELFEEDMAAQQAQINDRERSYKRGADNHGEPGADGRYIPSRGINIGRS